MTIEITFEPLGRKIQVESGLSLLKAARTAGIQIASLCGGVGLCESCVVHVRSGELSDLSLEEVQAREEGWLPVDGRLACQVSPVSDVVIDIPPGSLMTAQRLQLDARTGDLVTPDPVTRVIDIDIKVDESLNQDEMLKYMMNALEQAGEPSVRIDPSYHNAFVSKLSELGQSPRMVLRGDELVAVIPEQGAHLGIAIDVGTTKLAMFLVDLDSGETLAHTGSMNPQISFGEDVISRISYANQGEKERVELQKTLIERLNILVQDLCAEVNRSLDEIVEAVVVGNTVMHHSFLALPLHQLGVAPFLPAVEGSQEQHASSLGLDIAVGGYVYLPPNIAGYVGADHTATLLATNLSTNQEATMVVDIGTNTEISLKMNGRILSCSCASGPAFEGAHIRDGMRAAPGAIERVQDTDGTLRWKTIDDALPIGICGSGILDAVAALRRLGWIDQSGRLLEENTDPDHWHALGICLVHAAESGHGQDILITRSDVHEVQLAQGAIRAGIEVLLSEAGMEATDLEQVYLAGAFGTYLNTTSAMESGLLPGIAPDRIQQVGNAAGEGARQLLLSGQKRREVEIILDRVEYVELTTHPDFTNFYMKHLYFG